ncbi:hypothetical protein [Nitrosopumilus sp.]|uniref:hypothetical protein n=1 Tax=Nitrosopumilus sp. TaxID=2024843 RepID=UPI003D0A157D
MKLNQIPKIKNNSQLAKKTITTKYISLLVLSAILATALVFSNTGPADGVLLTGGSEKWKNFHEKSKVTIKSNGSVQISGISKTCQGQILSYTFSINGNKIVYDWTSVEKTKCLKKLKNGTYEMRTYEWHHVVMEVWEGKADNIKDTHEMMYSEKINPTRQISDTSSLMKTGDKLNVRVIFAFVEEGKIN